jgi:hypothetical protein
MYISMIYAPQAVRDTSVVLVFVVDSGFCFYCAALAVQNYNHDDLCGPPDSLHQLGP